MPKIVDHARRRDELADAVLRIIARDGISTVTMRSVASESGWSSGVLSHYFKSRNDLLLEALRRAAYLQGNRFKSTQQELAHDPIKQIEGLMEDILPMDERRLALTRIFLFFYAEAAQDHASREEIADYLAAWRRIVSRSVRAAQLDGKIASELDPEVVGMQLVAYADALSMHAVLDPSVLKRIREEPHLRYWGSSLALTVGSSTPSKH